MGHGRFVAHPLFRRQFEFRVISVEQGTECLDGQFVVGALGKSRDGHAADDAGAAYGEGKRSSVRGVIGNRKALAFGQGFSFFSFSRKPRM